MKRFLLLAIPLLLLAGCDQSRTDAAPAKPAVDVAAEKAAIQKQSDDWKAAAKARDAAKTASFWADDATVVMSNMPMVTGRANLQKFVDDSFKDKNFTIDWTTQKIEVAASGDLGYETALTTVTFTQGKKVGTMKAFGTVVWKKQADGSWKAVVDQSTDQPPVPLAKK